MVVLTMYTTADVALYFSQLLKLKLTELSSTTQYAQIHFNFLWISFDKQPFFVDDSYYRTSRATLRNYVSLPLQRTAFSTQL
ncbi:hypothetical protein J6590_001805 [Homalodisca vitripennis]|nr:hypothetical protein J6590_001805 [Homalodisca vitripennis]